MPHEQRTHVEPIVDLYPGRAFVAHVTPGHPGALTVSAAVGADPAQVAAELRDGAGVVQARYAGPLAGLALSATVAIGGAADPRWTVRLINTSATVVGGGDLIVTYPAEVADEVVSLARLNELARTARRELHPRLALIGGAFHLMIDERFAEDVPPALREFGATIELNNLPDVTITHVLPITTFGLRFVPARAGLPRGGVEVSVTAKQLRARALGVPLGGADHATLTIAIGLGATHGRLALGPVEVKLAWEPTGLANLGLVRSKIEAEVRDALTAALASLGARLAKITALLRTVFQMVELLDVRVTTTGLVLRKVGTPPTAAPALSAPAPSPRGRLQRLVIVMMENRSYDHLLRDLFATRPDLGTATPYHEVYAGQRYDVAPATHAKVRDDPPHGSVAQRELQAAGRWCEAYDRAHAKRPVRHDPPGEVLRFQPRAHVPVYAFLADHGCVCTDWRAAIPGQTWPNRTYALSGTSGGVLDNSAGGFDFYDFPTVCDVLEAQRVPWRYYYSDVPFLELYRRWAGNPPRPDGTTRLAPLAQFEADAAAGALPRVSWVEPNIADFGSEAGTDDHPPADVRHGQHFVRQVYEALRGYQTRRLADAAQARAANDPIAAATAEADAHDWLLVVTYDEHGGFWDSRGIGPAVDDDHAATRQRGFRVPTFLVSPWLGRSTCAAPLDHATLVRTVLDQFCGPEDAIGRLARVASAASLADVLDGGVGAAWPSPLPAARVLPKAPDLSAGFTPPDFGVEGRTEEDGPGVTTPLWEAFRAARDGLLVERTAAPAPPVGDGGASEHHLIGGGLAGGGTESGGLEGGGPLALAPTPPPLARLEGLAVTADDDELAALLTATGWRHERLGADPARALLVPAADLDLRESWRVVDELRAGFPDVDLEPLWETFASIGAPDDEAGPDPDREPTWAIEKIGARTAWDLASPTGRHRGAGVIVAHLDTGWTDHPELAGVFDHGLGWDFVGRDPIARDELDAGLGLFPGHGTATASVLASRERDDGALWGAAPEATLIPFRVSRSVIHLSTVRMARAIAAAVDAGAHVISISAGGLWSWALARAVRDATRRGVVIVAAAGNHVRTVVWPARFPDVIALGATDRDDQPWRGSSRGPRVALTAPGVAVPCAKAGGGLRPGTGTSYATALTAGAVATWLSFHGRDRLLAMYGPRGLADAARRALMRSARMPQHPGLGAGVLDMPGLLRQPVAVDPVSWFGTESAVRDDDAPRDATDERRRFYQTLGDLGAVAWQDLPGAPA
jgi:phospholipase C